MGTISFSDGTGVPVTLTLSYDLGDFSVNFNGNELNELVKIERRGKFVSAARGARTYPTASFSVVVTSLTGAVAPGSAADFLLKQAAYSSNETTLGTGQPYAIDITLTVEGTDFGDSGDETIVLDDCVLTDLAFSEGEPDTIAFSVEVLGPITGSLAAAEIA
jgi:hypothetical protein